MTDDLNQNVKKLVSTDDVHKFFITLFKAQNYAAKYQTIFNNYLNKIKEDAFARRKVEYRFAALPDKDDEIITPSTFISAQLDDNMDTDVLYILLMVHIGIRRMMISKVLGPRWKASIAYQQASSSGLKDANEHLRNLINHLEEALSGDRSDEEMKKMGFDEEDIKYIKHVKKILDDKGLSNISDFPIFMKFFDVLREPENKQIRESFYQSIYDSLNEKPTGNEEEFNESISEMIALKKSYDKIIKTIKDHKDIFERYGIAKEDINRRLAEGWKNVVNKAGEFVRDNIDIFFRENEVNALNGFYGEGWLDQIIKDVKNMTPSPVRITSIGCITLPDDSAPGRFFVGYLSKISEIHQDANKYNRADEYPIRINKSCRVEFAARILDPHQHDDVDMYLWWTDRRNQRQVSAATARGVREILVHDLNPQEMDKIRLIVIPFEGTFTYRLQVRIIL